MIKVAHLEPLPNGSYLMRVGPEGWRFGEPYELIAVAVDLGDGVAEMRGLDTPLCGCHWRAMAECGREHGFKTVVFDRIKDGVKTRKTIEL